MITSEKKIQSPLLRHSSSMHCCSGLGCKVGKFNFHQRHFAVEYQQLCTLFSLVTSNLHFAVFALASCFLQHYLVSLWGQDPSEFLCLNGLAQTLNELIFLVINPSEWESFELINCETPNFGFAFLALVHFQSGVVLKPPAVYHCCLLTSGYLGPILLPCFGIGTALTYT